MEESVNDRNPLVSVGILTYNSSKTVLETLESIKAQTYKNIELIISDDGSKDNSVEVCQKWIDENKDRFVRCEIVTVPENTGIPANANRRVQASQGTWIKTCGADDLLAPDCVENFINYVNEHPEADVVFAKYQRFNKVFDEKNFERISDMDAKWFCSTFKTPEAQYKKLLIRMHCHPVTMFAKRDLLFKIKYDESIKFSEDAPMWLRLTKSGVLFHYMDKIVAYYRLSDFSSSGNKDLKKVVSIMMRSELFRVKYVYDNVPFLVKWLKKGRYYEYKFFEKIGLLSPKSGKLGYFVLAVLYTLTSPQFLYYKLKRKLNNRKLEH